NALFAEADASTTTADAANYAVFAGLSGPIQTVEVSIPDYGGIAGFQVVSRPSSTNNDPQLAVDAAEAVVNETEVALNSGSISDADDDDVTLTASVGNVVNNNDGTWSWNYTTSDGPTESQTVTITADDGQGGTAEVSFVFTVNNVAPTADAGADQSVYRNETVNLSGSWSDPAGAADDAYTWSWDLDGDDIADDSGSANFGDTIDRSTSFAVTGVATLTFTITDKDGDSSSDTVLINVANHEPVADDQNLSVDEDTALSVTLTASDDDDDALSYAVLSQPSNGTLSGTAPDLTYTPFGNFNGSDSFTFKVNDGLADSNEATVDITVDPVNDAPVALADTVVTDEDTAVEVDVQANDNAGPADEDQTLTTTDVTDPADGSAEINADGTVTYTPDSNFNGSDSFDYTVCDSDDDCATATVTVLVAEANDPPEANDDTVSVVEDTPTTIDVAANDSDVDGNLDPSTVTALTSPSQGSLNNNGDGTFTYTPNLNYVGSDSFSYQICDSDGVCDNASVTITVTAVNDAPSCTAAAPSISTLWPPNGTFHTITVNGISDVEGDSITINIDTIFQDEPVGGEADGQGINSETAKVRAERDGSGNGRFYHIGFTASDGNGGSCSGTVKVSVPKSQGNNGAAVDDGALYDSTTP
ncbi:MAG: tandem-95 repeat protein, partial [Anaerolineae bacterium]|nr:tandem-95 repeat protein [Anaerolineae bacterium]